MVVFRCAKAVQVRWNRFANVCSTVGNGSTAQRVKGLSWSDTIRSHSRPSGIGSRGNEIRVFRKPTLTNEHAVPANSGLGKNFG